MVSMSRRKSPTDQLADDIGCMIIGILWVAAVGLFSLLFKATQVAPEDQLLKLQPGFAWWWRIEPQDCPDCGAVNESYKRSCFQCGATLTRPVEAVPAKTAGSSFAQVDYGQSGNRQASAADTAIGLIVVVVIVALVILVLSGGLS
jgi:predicted nucleic acid-binding Zn ribbon protein